MFKLSVILITYNHEVYIKEAIESILMQKTDFDIELIVADDCSTDNTREIIQSYEKESDIDFRFLENVKNLGLVKNYQRAFASCNSEYVAILEGDDYWCDNLHLQKHVDFLSKHLECVLSFNRIIHLNQHTGKTTIPDWNLLDDFEYITTNQMALGNRIGNLSACVIRNIALQKIKPDLFEMEIADWMLGMVLGQFGFLAHLKDATSVYRIHAVGEWSKMSSIEQFKSIVNAIDIYNKYLDYKYDVEFSEHKNLLISIINQKESAKITDFLPSFLVSFIKWIIPLKLRRYLRKFKRAIT